MQIVYLLPGQGGGGGLQYENAWMCVLGSENAPIMKDAFGNKDILISKGSSAHLIPISWCNIKIKGIIHTGYSQSVIFLIIWYSLCWL